MHKRNVLNSPRLQELKRRRQKIFLRKFILALFVFLVIFAGLAYISRISSFNIKEIEVTGNKVVDTEVIKISVEKAMLGNYLFVFPKTNVLFYPKNDIKKELGNEFKRLKDINLSIKDNKILEVNLGEREAKYIWCGDTPESGSNSTSKCYFLDETGFIFDEAPYFSGEVYFKFYGRGELGSYLSGQNFQKLILFIETLEGMGLKPAALYMQGDGDIKMFLSASSSLSLGPEIIFKADSDFVKVAENLQAALTTEPLLSDFKNKYSSLLYIDLRFGNKVYFKFK